MGHHALAGDCTREVPGQNLKDFIKIVLVKAGGNVVIDFKEHRLQKDAFFFINTAQYYCLDVGLPPALVQIAENDKLRDEGEECGRKSDEAGVAVTVTRYNGMIEG